MEQEKLNSDTLWNIRDQRALDNSTVEYSYVKFDQGGDVTDDSSYRAYSTDRSGFYYLPASEIQVTYQVCDANGDALNGTANDDDHAVTALCSSGWSLFKSVKVRLEDNEIVSLDRPGMVSQMNNVIFASRDYIDNYGEASHTYIDHVAVGHGGASVARVGAATKAGVTTVASEAWLPSGLYDEVQGEFPAGAPTAIVQRVRNNPNFDPSFKKKVDRSGASQILRLPLSEISGLFKLNRVVQGSKLEVELTKNSIGECGFGALSSATLKITRVALWMARVKPNFEVLSVLEAQIAKNALVETMYEAHKFLSFTNNPTAVGSHTLSIASKISKPTSVLVAWGYSDRLTDVTLNPLQWDCDSYIDHVDLRVNGRMTPNVPYDPSSNVPQILSDIYQLAGKKGNYLESPILTPKLWSSVYPIFAFDLEHQEGSSYESRESVNLDLNYTIKTTIPANVTIYVLINSEANAQFDYKSGLTKVRTF